MARIEHELLLAGGRPLTAWGNVERPEPSSEKVKGRSVELWEEASWSTTSWLGRPIAQLPHDLVLLQEILYDQQPGVVVETGLALGGSAVFMSSILNANGGGRVISVEFDVKDSVRTALSHHPFGDSITIVEGDSTVPATVEEVRRLVAGEPNVLVVLDSDHSRDHVRRELEAYYTLVPPDGWLVVFDGVLEWVAELGIRGARGADKRWIEDNPLAAIREFLRDHSEFHASDRNLALGATFAPSGFLRRSGNLERTSTHGADDVVRSEVSPARAAHGIVEQDACRE
jgi:cephalosporin hydroxylase